MIKLSSKDILPASTVHLASVQQQVDNEASFELKVQRAESKWNNKTGSEDGRLAFKDIKDTLTDMSVGLEICVYCEHNEATDIEHIYPKRLYPEKAFIWDNYVLACGKCNTHYKKAKFSIFNPAQTILVEDITPKKGQYTTPENNDALFINQRVEDPMEFLELDLVNKLFIFTEKHPEGTREFLKARYTKEILGLNTRDELVAHRKTAVRHYLRELEKYAEAKSSNDFDALFIAVNGDYDGIDKTIDFELEKSRILEVIKEGILKYYHPAVWKELKRQRGNLPKTRQLFEQAPEALEW
jgi:hypothetical protein